MTFFFLFAAFPAALLVWMAYEARSYRLSRYPVTVRKSFPGKLRILHLSDIHFSGPNAGLARFFDRLASEEFDLVMLSGDVFDTADGLEMAVKNLSKLRARLGKYAVLGNHDYFDYRLEDLLIHFWPGQGPPAGKQPNLLFENALEKSGFRVMKNEAVEIPLGETGLHLHGLDDPTTGRANVRKAMESYDASKLNLLLTHSIDAFLDIGEGEIDLSFSGHSHGGQICLPGVGPVITHTLIGRSYAAGIKSLKGSVCSVSRGMGSSRFMPFRLLCPPEAILLEVHGL